MAVMGNSWGPGTWADDSWDDGSGNTPWKNWGAAVIRMMTGWFRRRGRR